MNIFMHLGYHAKNTSWLFRFKMAGIWYLLNKSDVQIYGVLIRDVPAKSACVQGLAEDCPAGTTIEILSIYRMVVYLILEEL